MPNTDPTAHDISMRLSREVATILGRDDESVTSETALDSLGMDSIRLVELLIFIEREYGVKLMDAGLTRDDLHSPTTLAEKIFGLRR